MFTKLLWSLRYQVDTAPQIFSSFWWHDWEFWIVQSGGTFMSSANICSLIVTPPLYTLCKWFYSQRKTWIFTLVDSIDSIIVLHPVQVIQELKRYLVWRVIELQYWILCEGEMNLQHKHLTGWSNHEPYSSACRRCLVQTQALVGGIEPAHYLFQLKAWQRRH